MAGGFITANTGVNFERDAVLVGISNTIPQIKICSGTDCTDTNATFITGTASAYTAWDSSNAPAHVLSQVFIPEGYRVELNNTSNTWVSYKYVGQYGAQ